MKNHRTHIVLGAALLLLGVSALIYTNRPLSPLEPAIQVPQSGAVSLTIQGLYEGKQVGITADETALQLLQSLNAQDSRLQLTTKEYAGMGTLVTGMHGNENGSGTKYWQYKVNGVAPQIGAGAYVLKNGDAIEWFFGASQE